VRNHYDKEYYYKIIYFPEMTILSLVATNHAAKRGHASTQFFFSSFHLLTTETFSETATILSEHLYGYKARFYYILMVEVNQVFTVF